MSFKEGLSELSLGTLPDTDKFERHVWGDGQRYKILRRGSSSNGMFVVGSMRAPTPHI